jgi:hypothetical protein
MGGSAAQPCTPTRRHSRPPTCTPAGMESLIFGGESAAVEGDKQLTITISE